MELVRAEDLSGLLWAFIIVGSIIAKVVGAARENKAAKRKPPSQTPPPTAASSELRDFLEQLAGTPQPVQPPRAPTPPPVRQPVAQPVIVRQPPQIKPPKPATKPPPPPPKPKPEPTVTVKSEALPRPQASITGDELAAMFGKSPAAARRAIVLAEVLGKPLAMRESPSSL